VRQVDHEKSRLLLNAANPHQRFAKIGLGMPRLMPQWDKNLPLAEFVAPDVILDDGIATRKSVFIAQALNCAFR
jgi:hypothetical protein